MLKKLVTVTMILSFVLAFGKDFQNVKQTRIISKTEDRVVLESDGLIHRMQVKRNNTSALLKGASEGVLDTILRFTPPKTSAYYDDLAADYQNNGAMGGMRDTVIKRYTLIAPGTVKKVMMQNKHAGTASLQFWGPCFYRTDESRYVNLPENSYTSGDVTVPGAQPLLPYSASWSCEAQDPEEQFNEMGQWAPQWNEIDLDATYPGMNPFLTGDSMELWIGYATDGVSGPSLWQDGEYFQTNVEWGWDIYSHSTLKYANPEPATYYVISSTNADDTKNALNHIMQIVVEYPAVPPFIENVTELSNMYATEATVKADVFDLDSESFTAQLQYKIGSDGEVQYTDMTPTGNGDEYEATLSGSVGDTIYYVVKGDDGELSQTSHSSYIEFVIKEKPAGKNILVVKDGGYSNDSLYYEVLGDEKTHYWLTSEEGGLHKSVINGGFDLIFITGYGTQIVPMFDEEDVYGIGEFLDNGGDLMLTDPDWAFANETATSKFYVGFQPGDFAYDYFGIDTLINDPANDDGSLADIEFTGFAEHPISADFTGGVTYGPLMYSILGASNWGDFPYPNDEATAGVMFIGATNNYPAAVSNKTETFGTIYCGFWPEVIAAEQFSEFETLINNIVNNTTAIEKQTENIAMEFALEQNYPNPFNPTTRIEFAIPERSQVSLKIYDINGQLVKTLTNSMKAQGRYDATWDATNSMGVKVSSGVYFYKLQTANNVITKKMLLMK